VLPAIQAAAQLLQVAAFVVVLYVDPAMQAVHPVFAVVVHIALLRVPAAQTVHAVQVAAFVVVLYVDPATQDIHPVFAVVVHTVLLRLPAGHVEQAAHALFVVAVHATV
jgi:hypothetical protein